MTTTPPPPAPVPPGGPSRSPWLIAGLVVLGVVLVALLVWLVLQTTGDDDTAEPVASPAATSPAVTPGESPSPTATPTPTATDTPTPTPTETAPLPDAGLGPFGGGSEPGEEGTWIADVRAAVQDGYDRVVFEFTDVVPTYRVEYAQPPFVAISGQDVEVAGDAFVQVRLEGTSAFDLIAGEPVYEGPQRISLNGEVVTEVVNIEDFEALVVWVIGVESQQPVRVWTLDDPARLVIDVQQ